MDGAAWGAWQAAQGVDARATQIAAKAVCGHRRPPHMSGRHAAGAPAPGPHAVLREGATRQTWRRSHLRRVADARRAADAAQELPWRGPRPRRGWRVACHGAQRAAGQAGALLGEREGRDASEGHGRGVRVRGGEQRSEIIVRRARQPAAIEPASVSRPQRRPLCSLSPCGWHG